MHEPPIEVIHEVIPEKEVEEIKKTAIDKLKVSFSILYVCTKVLSFWPLNFHTSISET